MSVAKLMKLIIKNKINFPKARGFFLKSPCFSSGGRLELSVKIENPLE